MNNEQNSLPELIDSCRPQADDLQLPELQALSAAIQADPQVDRRLKKSHRIDSVIGQSIRDVATPAGLEERLLAALAPGQPRAEWIGTANVIGTANEIDAANAINTAEEISPADNGAASVDAVPIVSRRVALNHWKVWLSALGASAAVVIAILFFHESVPRFASQEDVATQSIKWLDGLVETNWADTSFPDKEFPRPQQPGLRQLYRWQPVASASSSLKVACYNIAPTQPATHLFVCLGARSPELLPATPPLTPCTLKLKPGWLFGVWQSGGVVYVLAVQGNAQRYEVLTRRIQAVASTARPRAKS